MRQMIMLLATFISLASLAQAQTAKPTKEQTIEFLKAQLLYASGTEIDFSSDTKNVYLTQHNTIMSVSFSDCMLTFKVKNVKKAKDEDVEYEYTYSLSIADIENIDSDYTDESAKFEGSYIVLYTPNKKKLIKGGIVRKDGKEKSDWEDYRVLIWCSAKDKEQTLKAFNYLRKLCGAPEPIKFD